MEIKTVSKIMPREALDIRNEVMVIDKVEIPYRNSPPSTWILAAGHKDGASISVQYHGGRKNWSLVTEHLHEQKATHWETIGLEASLSKFEEQLGVELPPIQVIEYGVGIYAANKRLAFENPWKMVDGEHYQTVDRLGHVRIFEAKVANGATRVAKLDESGEHYNEFYDPAILFTMEEWKSLKRIDGESAPAPNKPRMRP